jgi:acyl-lipid omega-6 desaturase (Delta-12 desaturase)
MNTPNAASWKQLLAPYAQSSTRQGALAVATSAVPYLIISGVMYLLYTVSPWLTFTLTLPAAAFLVRTFVVFHDCCHGALFPTKRANAIVGSCLGLLVVTPFTAWRHEHAIHHGSAGDLDRRGVGDVETLTVAEYHELPTSGRFAYRASRNPGVLFLLGPILAMIIGPRIAVPSMRARVRNSVLLLDLALVVAVGLLVWAIGPIALLLIWLPTAMLSGVGGIFLFFVQHQFEGVYWERHANWNYFDAALQGSSYLKMGRVGNFFSANIGYHHVHHLAARIPHYNLPAAHRASPAFARAPMVTIRDGIRCLRLKLYDERAGRMVTFADARRGVVAARPLPSGAA